MLERSKGASAFEDITERLRRLESSSAFDTSAKCEKSLTKAIIGELASAGLMWPLSENDASIGEIARINYQVARVCGSAGLLYAMHMSQALTVIRHGGEGNFFREETKRFIENQTLVASATSEKNVGGNIFGTVCAVETLSDGGLKVVKESPNISYLDEAGAILLTAMQHRNGKPTQVLILLNKENLVIEGGSATGFSGMQGLVNRPYKLQAAFQPGAVFADDYPTIARRTMTPAIHILWAALWSGLAASALDKARSYVTKKAVSDVGADALMRQELSRLADMHYTMNALIRDAVRQFESEENVIGTGIGIGRTARVTRLKIVCSDLLMQICNGALQLTGISGYAQDGPFSLTQIVRDAQSAQVMVSNLRLRASNAKIERYIDDEL